MTEPEPIDGDEFLRECDAAKSEIERLKKIADAAVAYIESPTKERRAVLKKAIRHNAEFVRYDGYEPLRLVGDDT